MTAIATGSISDAEKGWRVALRYALGDMAQNELMKPRRLKLSADEATHPSPSLPLFDT